MSLGLTGNQIVAGEGLYQILASRHSSLLGLAEYQARLALTILPDYLVQLVIESPLEDIGVLAGSISQDHLLDFNWPILLSKLFDAVPLDVQPCGDVLNIRDGGADTYHPHALPL